MTFKTSQARQAGLVVALVAASLLGACAPVLIGGAVAGSAMVATDRRSTGTQVDDSSNEVKSVVAVDGTVGDRGHVNSTSYNRMLLLTGEVPTEADKAAIEKAVRQIGTVRSTVNDLAVMPNSSLSTRSNDSITTGKVKAQFFDAKDLSANSIKVVTERGNVYLMGLVTETEAQRAVELTRSVGGVQKVVRVFQIITPAELAAFQAATAPQPAATAGSAVSQPGAQASAPAPAKP
jgi:osmotically-inducible protein OsmY